MKTVIYFLGLKFIPLQNGKQLYEDKDQQASGFVQAKGGTNCKKKQSFPKHSEVLHSHNCFFTESEYNEKKAQNSSVFCCQRKRLPNATWKSSECPDSRVCTQGGLIPPLQTQVRSL